MTSANPVAIKAEERRRSSVDAVLSSIVGKTRRYVGGWTLVNLVQSGIVAAAYLLSQGDVGIRGDARIYMARLLADLDPDGVGRDVMFVNDGQSAFSLFGAFAKFSARHIGLASTVELLTLSATMVWGLAILVLVKTLQPGRAFALISAAVLILPRWYTPWHLIGAGEALAIPRPFAEAAALMGLALLLQGRLLACAGLLAGSAMIHPIMAAPAFGVLFLELARRDRRWYLAALVLVGIVAVAAFAAVPLASRLLVTIDPPWFSILLERNPYLFLSTWDTDALALEAIQIITILIASTLVDDPWRRLLRSVVAVAILGCLASAVLCDGLHLLLFAQIQAWRSLWLTAVFGALAAGLCLVRLPSVGPRGRLTLLALVAAWTCLELQPIGIAFAAIAVVLLAYRTMAFSRGFIMAFATLVAVVVCGAVVHNLKILHALWATAPAGVSVPFAMTWRLTMTFLVVIGLLFTAWAKPTRKLHLGLGLGVLPVILIGLGFYFDDRSALKKDMDAGTIKTDLVELLASRPGEILWIGGDENWYWARRANWSNALHGASIVFSRDLALLWQDRASALVSYGLAQDGYVHPWKAISAPPLLSYNRVALTSFCHRSDAPAWIVLPMTDTTAAVSDADVRTWVSPFKQVLVFADHGEPVLKAITHRLILPCRLTDPKSLSAP